MTTHQDKGFTEKAFVDPTPMPEGIPHVDEVGATSAPLKSASFFIGQYCKAYNEDFMLCKNENNDPAHCLKEGRKVTRCAIDLYENKHKRGRRRRWNEILTMLIMRIGSLSCGKTVARSLMRTGNAWKTVTKNSKSAASPSVPSTPVFSKSWQVFIPLSLSLSSMIPMHHGCSYYVYHADRPGLTRLFFFFFFLFFFSGRVLRRRSLARPRVLRCTRRPTPSLDLR